MKLRIILIFIALVIAIIAVVAVVLYTSNIRASAEKEVEKIEVLVATQNIPKETFIETLLQSDMVELQAIPRKYIADNVLTSLDQYKGYVTVSPISKGEQITSTKFSKPEQIGLAFTIPDDMVAVSIAVDEVKGVSNLISVGDLVNVIATFEPKDKESEEEQVEATVEENVAETSTLTEEEIMPDVKEPITITLLWNIKVLYIGTHEIIIQEATNEDTTKLTKDVEKAEEKKLKITTVTLALTPQDAEKLVFSEEMGRVWLALLPAEGIQDTDTTGRTFKNIFE